MGTILAPLAEPTPLQLEQMCFRLQTARKSRQPAGGADHPMARDHDGDGISSIRRPYRARGLRVAQLLRKLSIAACFAERDGQQRSPYVVLEFRSNWVEF